MRLVNLSSQKGHSSKMICKTISAVMLLICIMHEIRAQRWRTIQVGVGDHCALGAAPVGPGGSFQVVERGVSKVITLKLYLNYKLL